MANNSNTTTTAVPKEALIFSIIFKFIAMAIGVMGNVAVVIYNLHLEKEKTPTSYLVTNLAVADLLVCLTFYPIWIIEFIRTLLDVDSDQNLFCKLSRSSSWTLLFVSVATLTAITVDRYIFIVKPLKYRMIVTRRRTISFIFGVWLSGFGLFYVLYLTWRPESTGFRSICVLTEKPLYWFLLIIVYIPLFLMCILNFKMLAVGRKQRKQILAETPEVLTNFNEQPANTVTGIHRRLVLALKSAKTFLVIVMVLAFCCFIPSVVMSVLHITKYRGSFRELWYAVLQYELFGINSIVNPFIYGMRHVKYKKVYEHMIFKLLLCNRATDSE